MQPESPSSSTCYPLAASNQRPSASLSTGSKRGPDQADSRSRHCVATDPVSGQHCHQVGWNGCCSRPARPGPREPSPDPAALAGPACPSLLSSPHVGTAVGGLQCIVEGLGAERAAPAGGVAPPIQTVGGRRQRRTSVSAGWRFLTLRSTPMHACHCPPRLLAGLRRRHAAANPLLSCSGQRRPCARWPSSRRRSAARRQRRAAHLARTWRPGWQRSEP